MEALYEFTVLKVRASILSKKNAEESSDTKNDDDLDGDDDAHDTAYSSKLGEVHRAFKSIVVMLKYQVGVFSHISRRIYIIIVTKNNSDLA